MGRSGTEAAREASDVVLTDDNFATIVSAIREGRRIADNIRRALVAFLLSANFGEVVLFAVAILAGLGAPMTVVQVLVVNLLTDGLPAVALAHGRALARHDAPAAAGLGTLLGRELSRPSWGSPASRSSSLHSGPTSWAASWSRRGPDDGLRHRRLAEAGAGLRSAGPRSPAWRAGRNWR